MSGIAFEQDCIANFCLLSRNINLAQVGNKDGEFMCKLLTV